MKEFDVKAIVSNVLTNYDAYAIKLIQLLALKGHYLFCPSSLEKCIDNRKTYSCSISLNKPKRKVLENVFPIMIGSKLDMTARQAEKFELPLSPNLVELGKFTHTADIAVTLFLIGGALKMLPFLITNDSSNIHVIGHSIVRIYRYTPEYKGIELNLCMESGRLNLRLPNGTTIFPSEEQITEFFNCRPYPTCTKKLFQFVYQKPFQIDHLANKTVFSAGRIFYLLFVKNLFFNLDEPWKVVVKKHKGIVKSIEQGDFLPVLSKKTVFQKDDKSEKKELGADCKVYVEKKSTCYRSMNMQTYPLIPYLSQTAFFQISSKVKTNSVLSFKESYAGFLCLYGTSESKNVGRQMQFVKNVCISTEDDMSLVMRYVEHDPTSQTYVVINSACVAISKSPDLIQIKNDLKFVECYADGDFTFINYKQGMLFVPLGSIWVTPKDRPYWVNRFGGAEITYDSILGHYIHLIPFFQHNPFSKNILALNAMKHAILANTPEFSIFFRETISAYNPLTQVHEMVSKPQNEFSVPWTLYLPKMKVMFTCYQGKTQEDCIVLNEKSKSVFDCLKLYTIKIKLATPGEIYFRPIQGETVDPAKSFLGSLYSATHKLNLNVQSIHVQIEFLRDDQVAEIYFSKPYYYVIHFSLTPNYLFLTIQNAHACGTADKICSLAGQKGVVFLNRDMPYAQENGRKVVPDLLVNPHSILNRQTIGQLLEMKASGKDYAEIFNSAGVRVIGRALIGSAFYFSVNYLASDHIYTANNCSYDKVNGQPMRGRQRNGGMRVGEMEVANGIRANNLGAIFEEVVIENSNSMVFQNGIGIPRSHFICNEDAKFFKCCLDVTPQRLVEEKGRRDGRFPATSS